MRTTVFIPLFLFALETAAFEPQSAAFSSRSTQGFQWTGGAEIVRERFDITVHRDLGAAAPADAVQYASAGVPGLDGSDIFPARDEAYDQSLLAWLVERGWTREQLLRVTRLALVEGLPAGLRLSVRDGALRLEVDPALRRGGMSLRLAIHDLSGRLVHAWRPSELGAGELAWAPGGGRRNSAGTYVLKVTAGGKAWSRAFRIP